jgi:hypothetical protein
MTIMQFKVVVNDQGHSQVFGMDEKSIVYRWDYQKGQWEIYIKKEEKKLDK